MGRRTACASASRRLPARPSVCAAESALRYLLRVILRRSKLPMALIKDGNSGGALSTLSSETPAASGVASALPRASSANGLLALEPFEAVFGRGKTRKRPKLLAADLASLAAQVASKTAVSPPTRTLGLGDVLPQQHFSLGLCRLPLEATSLNLQRRRQRRRVLQRALKRTGP